MVPVETFETALRNTVNCTLEIDHGGDQFARRSTLASDLGKSATKFWTVNNLNDALAKCQ